MNDVAISHQGSLSCRSSSYQPTMPTTIDYRCYPHIISTILTMSSVKVLETFRQTSTHFRHSREVQRIIDSKLYRHLGMICNYKNRWVDHKESLYLFLQMRKLPPSYYKRIIDLPATDSATSSLLVHTKILDICFNDCKENGYRFDSMFGNENEYPLLPSLEVVRFFARGSQSFSLPPCTTVIVFAGWLDPLDHHVLVEPSKMKRIVFPTRERANRTHYTQVSTGLIRVHWLCAGEVEEVVVINRGNEKMSHFALKDLVLELIFFLGTGNAFAREGSVVFNRVVLVGLEEERFKEEWAIERAAHVQAVMEYEISLQTILDSCVFYTYDEYLSTLGGDDEWLALAME